MSYCVNCGVKLDSSLDSCPLCHTPVINPNELAQIKKAHPYPTEKGQVDSVRRSDVAILTVIVLLATSISCLLLNLYVFTGTMWSLFIIGVCILLFVLLIPLIVYTKVPVYVSILFDGIALGFFLYLITFITPSTNWFFKLALPIVMLLTILAEVFVLLLRAFPTSFISTALYIFVEIAMLCAGLELLICHFVSNPLRLTWSAIVITVCGVIAVMLITVLCIRRLRDAIRCRFHF